MKRRFHHPEPQPGDLNGPRYWRSLDDLAETPAFQEWVEREFPEGAAELDSVNRRQFMKIMAASFGLAGVGLSGCSMPRQHILPYGKQPENLIPGVPRYYATSMPRPDGHTALIVETHEARPTKIEGNPSDTHTGGATDAFAQASVLDLYDNDRLQHSWHKGARLSRPQTLDLLQTLATALRDNAGKTFAVLAEPNPSPSRLRLRRALEQALPNMLWAEYTPVDTANPQRALTKATGQPTGQRLYLDKAKRLLAFDNDFLHTEPNAIAHARAFAKGRRASSAEEALRMNRLYVTESHLSLTGSMADHRLRVNASQQEAIAVLACAAILEQTGHADTARLAREKLGQFQPDAHTSQWLRESTADLVAHPGAALVLAGSHLPESLHLLVALANEALGGRGKTFDLVDLDTEAPATLKTLAGRLEAGSVETLLILGGNPAYDAPADLSLPALLERVPHVLRPGTQADETSVKATTVLAASHYLETWSDGRTPHGDYVPVQPMIMPLFDTLDELEVLARLAAARTTDAHDIVQQTFAALTGKASRLDFESWLAEGIATTTTWNTSTQPLKPEALSAAYVGHTVETPTPSAQHLDLRLLPSSNTWDGRWNNNGWLQELPDPITKLTWDNAIHVSPKLARVLDILPTPIGMNKTGQLNIRANTFKRGKQEAPIGTLTLNGRSISGPINIQPGLADWTVVVQLGYGRTATGRVGTGTGYNAYPLLTSDHPATATGATLALRQDAAPWRLATTQEHWSMEGRAIIRESGVTQYAESVEQFAKENDGRSGSFVDWMGMEAHSPPIYGEDRHASLQEKSTRQPRGNSLYKTPTFTDPAPNVAVWNQPGAREQFPEPQQWGMSIDLNLCTGCNACVTACQSENNIPIVGKDQVLRGREMHWIRLDRYYSTGRDPKEDPGATLEIPEDPQVSFMGMACAHCELAPCESVCPVNATVHDEQGLNVMAYNRCVGTRYCANNCPYKVRRFNFLDWNKREIGQFYKGPLGPNKDKTEHGKLEAMQKNPDVTVRMRGVMEKCTYCVQRIEAAKIQQKALARDSGAVKVPEGRIRTACQQVCPTEAIVFGDLSDPESAVSKAKAQDRDYSVLGYLNIRPRTTYLAKLRNPNPKMPGYRAQPLSRVEYENRFGKGHEAKDPSAHKIQKGH